MNHLVKLLPSGRTFECEPDETVLQAALRQGIILPYGCKNGACGSCKAELAVGQVSHGPHQDKALSLDEETRGKVLTCCAKPLGAIELNVRELQGAGDIPIRKLPCRVQSIEKPASDVAVIQLQLPANDALQFLAGQYIEFLLRDGSRRSYSMANPPHEQGYIELHIRHMPGGLFTDPVFNGTLKVKDILRFEGPMGTFYLRDGNKPMVMLASGTGFAPIQAILLHMMHKGLQRPVHLYWGGRKRADVYALDKAKAWAAQYDWLQFVPVLSSPSEDCDWQGRVGFVHQAVIQDHPDLSGFEVYACGAPVMVDSARTDFVQHCALPEDAFFADSFTSAADLK